jgi:excisionase family DNA binding protein
MTNQELNLLTVKDLAKQLKVKPSWIYGETRKTGEGAIPQLRVGKYIRFNLSDVILWLKKKQAREG